MAGEGTHLLCLTATSGVPLYCRTSRAGLPSRQQLPFSVIGSLNGVHMFGRNLDVGLSSARTEDSVVVWKTFHESITLIVLSSEEGASALSLERLLELVFGAMVLLIGLEELTNIRNVERLKKELREALSGFAESVGAAFACLVARGRVAVGTPGWWRLAAPESVLLPWLLGTLPPHTARDYPVYLPHGSPTVPHRLLTLTLLPGLELGLLCGPTPALAHFSPQLLDQWWQPLLEPLRACLLLLPRGLPPGLTLAPDILGLLFLHLEQRRCLFTVQPGGPAGEGPAPRQRRRLLRWWFSFVTAEHFAPEPSDGRPVTSEAGSGPPAQPRGCYAVGQGGHKLFALSAGPRRLLLLLAGSAPTHGLRALATRTLQALTPLL
ncbi:protein fuzzy homolog isoform X2 [Tachyglossus aculeatus]|uniref:protein fuzzy homolog isoform X2 n=1 Tax=Tachyglossus aculeatus TaxID=9261 RepID=UPI0018F4C43B|nr:protein fuzzy homolog isoform X2 [Tachyglossus aculeatus]